MRKTRNETPSYYHHFVLKYFKSTFYGGGGGGGRIQKEIRHSMNP